VLACAGNNRKSFEHERCRLLASSKFNRKGRDEVGKEQYCAVLVKYCTIVYNTVQYIGSGCYSTVSRSLLEKASCHEVTVTRLLFCTIQ